jgi:hypothetical protein
MQYSVLIPVGAPTPALEQLVPEVVRVLARMSQAFELVCVGSADDGCAALARLAQRHGCLKIVPIDPRSSLSDALSAGIAAARGDVVVAIETSRQYLPEQIPWLVERLSRADLVTGRRARNRFIKLWLAVVQLPRRALLGLEVRDPDLPVCNSRGACTGF